MEENNLEKEKNVEENVNTDNNQNNSEERMENLEETQPKNNELKERKSNKKTICISTIIGILAGFFLFWILSFLGVFNIGGKVIATTNGKAINENMICENMPMSYKIEYLLESVDKSILNQKYQLTEEQQKEIDEQVEQCLQLYNQYYGYTEEQFLSANGFDSKDTFRDYMEFDYKRNLAFIDYLKETISEEEVNKYYEENVFGEINTKHMLVKVTEDVKDKDAKKMAEEIIKKLNKGKDFDKVAEEYGDKITFEELGYNGFDSNLVAEYVEASKKLENNSYSKEPVKTSYGYHVIYKIDQKEKPSLDDVRDKILTVLGDEMEEKDDTIRYKALIKLRENNGLKFRDKDYKQQYEEYCKNYGV